MTDKKFKNILITMFIIFLAAIPLLYFLSDPRDQSVKKVENEFGIRLPKSVKKFCCPNTWWRQGRNFIFRMGHLK